MNRCIVEAGGNATCMKKEEGKRRRRWRGRSSGVLYLAPGTQKPTVQMSLSRKVEREFQARR